MRDIGGQTVWELIDQGAAGSNVDLVISEGNCKVLKLSDKTGEGVMTMYQVFNGVYLMFNDFHMESCYSGYFVMARIIQKLLGGDREAPICEVEAELKTGQDADVLAFGAFLETAYGLVPERKSKFKRARDLALEGR